QRPSQATPFATGTSERQELIPARSGEARITRMSATPSSTTPNHGKIGTTSEVGGDFGQKPIQASHLASNIASFQAKLAAITTTPTSAVIHQRRRRKG